MNPCPHESILSGLKALSIRRDRMQLSQNDVGFVPKSKACVMFDKFFGCASCRTSVVVGRGDFYGAEGRTMHCNTSGAITHNETVALGRLVGMSLEDGTPQ